MADPPDVAIGTAQRHAGARTGDDVVIEVDGLVMRYGELEAVRGIDLRVTRGEVLAFLGPERRREDDDRRDP